MAVAVLRPLDAPPAEPVPVTALLLAPPPICAALRGRGGGLVLAVRPAGRVGAQAVLLSAVALEAGGRRGAELWLRGALLRRLGLAAGRRVAVWPVRRPPPLVWVLLGAAAAAGRAGRPAGGAVLARRGEALPGPGPGPGPLVLEARPALQGLLGNGTRVALAAPPPREAEAGPAPGGGAPCRRPAAPPLVSRFAAGRGRAEGPRLRAAPPCGGAGGGGAEVWVSRRGLLALGLFQGEWVRVSAEGAARPHLAALLARPPAWDYPRAARRRPPDGAALLAPALAFNLGCEPGGGTHVCLRRYDGVPGAAEGKGSRSLLPVPPFAAELHVEMVCSPAYCARAVYDRLLYRHFQTPRLVQEGDVLCVPTFGCAEFLDGNADKFLSGFRSLLSLESIEP
uniref:Peroxisomal biosis factor 6 n=1 Tax=Gallus gallus TaxID=9031 RepID=A0A8V0Z948_CHICK